MTEKPENPSHDLERQHSTVAQPAPGGAASPEPRAQLDPGLAEHGLRARAGQLELAASATRTPADATRSFDTAEGRLSYAELAQRLAAPLQAIDIRIRRGEYAARALDESLLLRLHVELSASLFPEEAGRYRKKSVQVGMHEPPAASLVAQRVRDYIGNLSERMQHLTGEGDDLLLEFLAYAEGELLSIHPFPDLNGRMSRLWLTEILRRLQLPPVDVVPPSAQFRARYLSALSAADRRDWAPLMALWKERLSQPATMNEIALTGCNPTPLASYLKALAVLRLVAEAEPQDGGDPQASGFWRDDVFVLRTRLTREKLCEFLLERYQPTPLIAPWGARSGFFEGSSEKTARAALAAISHSHGDRLKTYRSAIDAVRSLLASRGIDEKASDEKKLELLNLCRANLPDHLLSWLDACYVLTTEGRKFPPLLGTGGNEGSGSYVSGFAQQVVACIIRRGHDHGLDPALFGTATSQVHADQTPGHFSPQGSGGANSSSGFEGDVQLNAWDYLLCLEGTLFFTSASTRKHEFDPPQINFPFSVAPSGAGHGSYVIAEEKPKKAKRQVMEIWLPLWDRPVGLDELKAMFSEGRATLGARAAATGLDFARALTRLGIDRGITSFHRFAFLMRNGQSFFATALGRYLVKRNPDADLINQLERNNWLGSVQRHARDDNAPNAFRSAARQLDAALFALTQQASREALQAVLRHIGGIEAALGISVKAHEAVRTPAPRLSVAWAIKADDDSAEYRIATALAGLSLRGADGHAALHTRRHLVAVGESVNKDGDRKWEPTSRLGVWHAGPLANNLAALLHRRRLEAVKLGAEGDVLASQTGATRADLAVFLQGDTDDARIADLLAGLACVDLAPFASTQPAPLQAQSQTALPPAFALLKIFFTPESVLHALQWLPKDRSLRLPAEMPALLAGNNVQAAVRLAWQGLRALGVDLPGRHPPQAVVADGKRWLAALCIPLTFKETARLLRDLRLAPEAATEADSIN